MPSTRARRLLIVEDDGPLRRFLARMLSEWWTVETAEDGQDGLSRFRTVRPDVVLSDWVMPRLCGEEFLRALKQKDATVPVVVMTGQSSEEKAIASVPLACAYFVKPVGGRLLHQTLRDCLRESASAPDRLPEKKGSLSLCAWKQLVTIGGCRAVTLTASELKVFIQLWDRAGRLVTHKEIAEAATGRPALSAAIAAPISRRIIHQLRQKLEESPSDPQLIVSVHGQGVRLIVGVWG